MSTDFLLMVLPLRGSVWLTLGVLPVVVRSALAGAVVWLAPVTECLAVWLGRCRVRCALCLLPPRVLASLRPRPPVLASSACLPSGGLFVCLFVCLVGPPWGAAL